MLQERQTIRSVATSATAWGKKKLGEATNNQATKNVKSIWMVLPVRQLVFLVLYENNSQGKAKLVTEDKGQAFFISI